MDCELVHVVGFVSVAERREEGAGVLGQRVKMAHVYHVCEERGKQERCKGGHRGDIPKNL